MNEKDNMGMNQELPPMGSNVDNPNNGLANDNYSNFNNQQINSMDANNVSVFDLMDQFSKSNQESGIGLNQGLAVQTEQMPPVQTMPTQIEDVPPVQTIPTQMAEVPPVQTIPTQMEDVPPVQTMPTQMEDVPPVQTIPTQMDDVPPVQTIPTQMEDVPLSDSRQENDLSNQLMGASLQEEQIGEPVQNDVEKNQDSDLLGDISSQPEEMPNNASINNSTNAKQNNGKKNSKKLLFIVGFVCLLLIVLGVVATIIVLNSTRKSELVCTKEEIKNEFMLYETDTLSFKGNKFQSVSFQQEVAFYSDYLDMKSSVLEDSKNQFTGTGVAIQTEETETGFNIITVLNKDQFSSMQGINKSNYSKDSIKKIMTDKGYTCE